MSPEGEPKQEGKTKIIRLCKVHQTRVIEINNLIFCLGGWENIKSDDEMIVVLGDFIDLEDFYDKP